MRKVTATYEPRDVMSPEELAECRRHLERQWEMQRVDAAVLRRAWKTAYQVALMLYEDFEATHVAVFGSLTMKGWFTEFSDIDIAVLGLSEEAHFDAQERANGISAEFRVELVNFANARGPFRERLLKQAMLIKKWEMAAPEWCAQEVSAMSVETGKIYEKQRTKLTQRIGDELGNIEWILGTITEAMGELDVVAAEHRKFLEHSIAENLAKIYYNIARIFARIAREIDRHVPSSEEWHKALLSQMAEPRVQRPPVVTQETAVLLEELLEFRHKVRNSFPKEVVYELTEAHAKQIYRLFARVSTDLDRFADALTQHEKDEDIS